MTTAFACALLLSLSVQVASEKLIGDQRVFVSRDEVIERAASEKLSGDQRFFVSPEEEGEGAANGGRIGDQRFFVSPEEDLMITQVGEACYVGLLNTSAHGRAATPQSLYASDPLSPAKVAQLNSVLGSDCLVDDTWWLSSHRPLLPTLADYLASYSANSTAHGTGGREKRSTGERRPTQNLRQRLQALSSRLATGSVSQTAEGGGRVFLTDDPYPSPLFLRSDRGGQRFKHYKAFYDEIARNSMSQAASRPDTDSRADGENKAKTRKQSPQDQPENILNSYSLRIRGRQAEQVPQDSTHDKQRLQPLNVQRGRYELQQERQEQHEPEVLDNKLPSQSNLPGAINGISTNGKRHIIHPTNLRSSLTPPQGFHQNAEQFTEQGNRNSPIHIPDSIIKDGQVFYRADTNKSDNAESYDSHAAKNVDDFDDDLSSHDDQYQPETNSLIFSQALGSTGNDGSFQAEAEGRGVHGESTHSAVDGGQHGASAAASAIRFDQQALAHVQVSPHSPRQASSGSDATPEISAPVGISQADIAEMMKRNGFTGFAMATVTARKNGNKGKPLSSLGQILPGYSSSIGESSPHSSESGDFQDNHDIMGNIVEQVYDPPGHQIIDHGGLVGGAGDHHRESEFQQINDEVLPERGAVNGDSEGSVGLATYSQGIRGFPPGAASDYDELYLDYDRYNFNQPSYFPDENYVDEDGTELSHPLNGGHPDIIDNPNSFPTNLNTGIQYPIIEGDVAPIRNEQNHMIVDNTLSSYFPQPQHAPNYDRSRLHDPQHAPSYDQSRSQNAQYLPNYDQSRTQDPQYSPNYDHNRIQDPQYAPNYDYQRPQESHGQLGEDIQNYSDSYNDTFSVVPLPPYNLSSVPEKFHDSAGQIPYGYDDGITIPSDGVVNNYLTYQGLDFPSNYINVSQTDDYNGPSERPLLSPNSNNGIDSAPATEVVPDNIGEQYPPIHSLQGLDPSRYSPTGGAATQPAYNSVWEYERSRQRGVSEETSPASLDPHRSGVHSTAFDAERAGESAHSGRNFEDSLQDPADEDYDDRSYESSFETSSQSSSQSAQSVYTASHHYSYQHGSNERGIGSSTNTALIQPSEKPLVSVQPYYTPVVSNPSNPQQTSPPYPSPQSYPTSAPELLPRQDYSSPRRAPQPSASQGVASMSNMRVFTPGVVGSMQSLPPADPAQAEVKIVMAQAPSSSDSQQRSGRVILPGEKIPGTTGYMVPPGFRGRLVLGNIGMSSMSNAVMSPGLAQQLNNQMNGHFFPSGFNDNGQRMHMSLSSSSSAQSSGSGVSLSSSSTSKATREGELSATSSSVSNQLRGNNGNNYNSVGQPVYSYHQTYNANPGANYRPPNAIVGPYYPNSDQDHPNSVANTVGTGPGMRSKSWSSWKTSSWRTSGNSGTGSRPDSSGQYVSQSSSMPAANDCGYWSMRCNMIRSPYQQNEICRPTHIVLPCCC